jgi:hypothetical protein
LTGDRSSICALRCLDHFRLVLSDLLACLVQFVQGLPAQVGDRPRQLLERAGDGPAQFLRLAYLAGQNPSGCDSDWAWH